MSKQDLNNLPSNNMEAPNRRPQKANLRGSVRQGNKGGLASEVRDIFNSQFSSTVMPSIMRLIYDFFEGGLRMLILGKSGGGNKPRFGGNNTSYNSQYRSSGPTYHRGGRSGSQNYHQAQQVKSAPYKTIFFGHHEDAEDVLNIMKDTIHEFGWVSVGHLYSICGITNNHTHHSWGWTDVSRVGISRDQPGYFIDLPNPVAK